MKRIWMLTAALLLLSAGCSASTDPQSLAALENVMAVAAYSDELPEEPPAADPVCWDGDYGNGSRTITLPWAQTAPCTTGFRTGASAVQPRSTAPPPKPRPSAFP